MNLQTASQEEIRSPKFPVGSPENNFFRDLIWAWTSIPITGCHPAQRDSFLYTVPEVVDDDLAQLARNMKRSKRDK
jgi:hypothetical protein